MSSEEFTDWEAYYGLEPWGHRAEWFHTASILAMIANVNRGKGKRAYKPREFMPQERRGPKPKQSAGMIKSLLFAAFGKRIKKKDK